MKNRILLLIAPLFLFVLGGCATTNHVVNLNQDYAPKGAEPISAPIEQPAVKLAEGLEALVDRSARSANGEASANTGDYLGKVFTGGPDAPWSLERIGSKLVYTLEAPFPAPVPTARVTYEATFLLKGADGEKHLLTSNRYRESFGVRIAVDAAVKEAIADISKQVAVYTGDKSEIEIISPAEIPKAEALEGSTVRDLAKDPRRNQSRY